MDERGTLDDLLPARALGALDGEDLAALESALADRSPSGAALAARAASWTREIEALASTVDPIVPSDMTRARLLQRIAGESPERVLPPADRIAVVPEPAPTPWLLRLAAAAMLALLGWGAIDRSTLRRELAALRSNDQQLAAQLAAMHHDLNAANGEIVRLQTESRIVSAPDMHPIVLAGLEGAPASTARTFISPRDGKALFYAYGLPAAPAGKQYQLWFIADGKPVSGGVFDVDASGNGALLVDHVAPVETIQAWAVTLEPSGGLPAPSGAMVLKG